MATKETPQTLEVARLVQVARRLELEVGRVIIGQRRVVRETVTALVAGGHVLLEGVPGLGKTVLVRTIAQALEIAFNRVQFTPDLMPADVLGTNIIVDTDGGGREFRFQPGPVFANIILADEINRATPKTQSALLEAMQERQVTIGGQTRKLPEPFFVLATQNPLEQEGTYPLPEAQLDRFLFKVNVPFPTTEELREIGRRTTSNEKVEPEVVTRGLNLIELTAVARDVPMASPVYEYALQLVMKTHPDNAGAPETVRRFVRYGASPRGLQAIVMTSRVRALMEGRFNVAFEDVRAVAMPALRHRIFLNFEGEASGLTSDKVIEELLAQHLPEEE
jgi:MoxR-like ATPase